MNLTLFELQSIILPSIDELGLYRPGLVSHHFLSHTLARRNTRPAGSLLLKIGSRLWCLSDTQEFTLDKSANTEGFYRSLQPMWVLSARDGFPLRCVQYSADLARNVADLLLSGKESAGTLHKVGSM